MKTDFHVHDTLRVEYRVATDGPSFPRGYAQIERETRSAGGNGVLAACALAKWGANVLLTGNPIGDDEHGRFLQTQLEKIPNLTFKAQIESGLETPYAIMLRAGHHDVGTLLSRTAARVSLPPKPYNPGAGLFFGPHASSGESGTPMILRAPTQNYEALIGSLEAVCALYLSLLGEEIGAAEKMAFTECVVRRYQAAFGGPESVPGLEEIEAFLGGER